jgi:hypothetical protein
VLPSLYRRALKPDNVHFQELRNGVKWPMMRDGRCGRRGWFGIEPIPSSERLPHVVTTRSLRREALMIKMARKPSLWMGFVGRLLFGVVWAGGFLGFSWLAWQSRAKTPVFIFIILGLMDLIAIGVIWDLVVRFWRTLTNKQPVLEIDRASLPYGGTAQVRFAEPNPDSLANIDVRLVADHWVTTQHGNTTTSSYEPCYDEELLRMNVETNDPISRMLQIRIPLEPPAEDASWKIVVNTTLRQGGVIQHPYPLKVEKRGQFTT